MDPTGGDQYPLAWAIRNACGEEREKVVLFLLADARVDPSAAANGWALKFAYENGHIEVVQLTLIDLLNWAPGWKYAVA